VGHQPVPDEQHEHRVDDRVDETRTLIDVQSGRAVHYDGHSLSQSLVSQHLENCSKLHTLQDLISDVRRLVVKHDIQQGEVDLHDAVVLNKKLPKFVHEKS
jgi:hypothetical protein